MYPVFAKVGSFVITSYGLMACLGFLISFVWISIRARSQGWDTEIILDMYLLCTVAAVVGARTMYVLTYPESFLQDPSLILQVWRGGLTYYGSAIGVFLTAFLYCRRFGYPVGETLDIYVPFLALAHALGRIGCFLNGCCYGLVTQASVGVVFPHIEDGLPRHPTQLYEAGLEFLNFLILNALWKRGIRGGRVTLAWFSIYAFERFALEFWRGDTVTESYLFGLSLAQSVALVFGVLSAAAAARLEVDPELDVEAPLRASAEAEEGSDAAE